MVLLFAANLIRTRLGTEIAWLFIASMLAIGAAFVVFLIETTIAAPRRPGALRAVAAYGGRGRLGRLSAAGAVITVAMLTAGGLAPCLSSAVGGLIERYTEVAPDARIIAYRNGYAGLLTGKSVEVTDEVRANAHRLHAFGGSPIGNSRVKLTNVDDCVKRGLVSPGRTRCMSLRSS